MALFLFFEAFLKLLNQLFQSTQAFDFGFFFFGKMLFKLLAQPVFWNQRFNNAIDIFQVFKIGAKGFIKAIVKLLILNHHSAGQQIEIIDRAKGEAIFHRIEQIQQLADGNRYLGFLECVEKVNQHGSSLLLRRAAGHKRQTLQQMHILLIL